MCVGCDTLIGCAPKGACECAECYAALHDFVFGRGVCLCVWSTYMCVYLLFISLFVCLPFFYVPSTFLSLSPHLPTRLAVCAVLQLCQRGPQPHMPGAHSMRRARLAFVACTLQSAHSHLLGYLPFSFRRGF